MGGGAVSTGCSFPGNGKGQLNYYLLFDPYITAFEQVRKFRCSLLTEALYSAR